MNTHIHPFNGGPALERLFARGMGIVLVSLFMAISVAAAPAAEMNGKGLTNEFFAMDTGLHGPGLEMPEQKAKALKELGYPGIG